MRSCVFLGWGLVGVAMLFHGAKALNADDYKEGDCGEYTPQANFNDTWFGSNPDWFLAAGSKYHLYRGVAPFAPQIATMSEPEFAHRSCIKANLNLATLTATVTAFGLQDMYNMTLISSGIVQAVPHSVGEVGTERKYVTLTDNRSFVFFTTCWTSTNTAAWNIMSLTPTLPISSWKLIEDHARSLGFQKKNFLYVRYESCGRPQQGNPWTQLGGRRGFGQGRGGYGYGKATSGGYGWR